MTLFVLIAAIMTAAALLCLLPPLLRKSQGTQTAETAETANIGVLQDQLRELDADRQAQTLDDQAYASAHVELERRIASSTNNANAIATPVQKRLAIAMGCGIPVVVCFLYWLLGAPSALDSNNLLPQAPSQEIGQQQILGMVQKLAERMKQTPGDAQGWIMLGRSYFELQRYQEASDAYAHLVQLAPDNADYLASYALTLALARNKNLQGEPEQLLERALKLDPNNIRALSLMGSAAFDRRDYEHAIGYWNRVLPLVAPDSKIAQSTSSSIDEAKALQKDSSETSIIRLPNAGNDSSVDK